MNWGLWKLLPTAKDSFAKARILSKGHDSNNTFYCYTTAADMCRAESPNGHSRHTRVGQLYNTRLKRTLCTMKSRKVHNFNAKTVSHPVSPGFICVTINFCYKSGCNAELPHIIKYYFS